PAELMRECARQAAGSSEVLQLQHAALHLQLFQLFPGGKVTQDRNGISDLPATVVDFSGASGGFDFSPSARMEQTQRFVFLVYEGERKRGEIGVELGLIFH